MPSKHKKSRSLKKGKSGSRRRSSKKMMGGAGCGAPKQAGGSVASHEVMSFVNTSGPTVSDYLQMELPSRDSISNLKTQVQMGGDMVSDKVMSAKMGMNDYMSQLPSGQNGGAGCGANPKQAGGAGCNAKPMAGGAGCNAKQVGGSSGSNAAKQVGGSPASSRLDSFTQAYNTSTLNEKKQDVITADMIGGDQQPKIYELTGGSWGKSGKKKSMGKKAKGKKSKSMKAMRMNPTQQVMQQAPMQTGGSFWNMAGCGPWNGTDAGRKYADFFSKTSKCPGPEWYANPPELPKAGSGDAADLITGATYPFA